MTNVLPDTTPSTEHENHNALNRFKNWVKSKIGSLTEERPYFELAGHKLEKHNHNEPQSPEITIITIGNETSISGTIPQAWSKEIDGTIHWYYNFPGAIAEANHLNKTLPMIGEWEKMLKSVRGNVKEKADALGIPLVGLYTSDGTLCDSKTSATLWSSSGEYDNNKYIALCKQFQHENAYTSDKPEGMSVRFLFST